MNHSLTELTCSSALVDLLSSLPVWVPASCLIEKLLYSLVGGFGWGRGRAQPTRLACPTADCARSISRCSRHIRTVWSSEQEAIWRRSGEDYTETRSVLGHIKELSFTAGEGNVTRQVGAEKKPAWRRFTAGPNCSGLQRKSSSTLPW